MACRTVMLLYTPNFFFCFFVSNAWSIAFFNLLYALSATLTKVRQSLKQLASQLGLLIGFDADARR
jgi:hypothetical protein